jgi:HlyD family secretion protein
MRPSWLTRGRLVTALVIVAVIATLYFRATRPAELALVEPAQREVVEVVVASGRLRAVRQSQVGAEAAGVVEQLEVREGDRVKRGQRLGALRPGEVPARLAQSLASQEAASRTLQAEEAALRRAVQELTRARELAERKLVSAAELDRAESEVEVQRARAQAARARVGEATAEVGRVRPEFGRREVRAPFDGVIVQRLVEPGTSVGSSTVWFALAEMDVVELYVETDENNLGKLAVGQSAIAVAPAYPDQPFNAKLVQIGPNVDTDRGVVGVRLTAESVPAFALPNMTVDVNVEVRRTPSRSALPASSVGAGAAPFVLLRGADGRLVSTPVEVLGRNPEWVAVSGLPEGARVLRNVREGKAGQRVRG